MLGLRFAKFAHYSNCTFLQSLLGAKANIYQPVLTVRQGPVYSAVQQEFQTSTRMVESERIRKLSPRFSIVAQLCANVGRQLTRLTIFVATCKVVVQHNRCAPRRCCSSFRWRGLGLREKGGNCKPAYCNTDQQHSHGFALQTTIAFLIAFSKASACS